MVLKTNIDIGKSPFPIGNTSPNGGLRFACWVVGNLPNGGETWWFTTVQVKNHLKQIPSHSKENVGTLGAVRYSLNILPYAPTHRYKVHGGTNSTCSPFERPIPWWQLLYLHNRISVYPSLDVCRWCRKPLTFIQNRKRSLAVNHQQQLNWTQLLKWGCLVRNSQVILAICTPMFLHKWRSKHPNIMQK